MTNLLTTIVLCLSVACPTLQSSTFAEVSDEYQPWIGPTLFPSLPIAAPTSKDDICRTHSQLLMRELKNETLWAMQMWDSSAKSSDGVFFGNIYHLGNFDECLNAGAPFKVKFCVSQVSVNISSKYFDDDHLEKSLVESNAWTYIARSRSDQSKVPRDVLRWGLCVPASCNSFELEKTLNSHLESYKSRRYDDNTFQVKVNEEFCTEDNQIKEFTIGEIAFWAFSFTLILLTISSTITDLLLKGSESKHSKLYRMWMVFSVRQNFDLLYPSKIQKGNPLNILHGIKFISIMSVVYGHRVGVTLSLSAINFSQVETDLIRDHKMFFVHSDLVVDTFFFISGLVACHILMSFYTKQFINPIFPILVRIFRLAPLYFFTIWYQSTAAFRSGSGPLWNALTKNETQFCRDNWWTNVLFINNYVNSKEMCLQQSWFLPCEMHFFIVATFLIPICVNYYKVGRFLLAGTIVGSAIIPAVIIYIWKIHPLILFYYDFLSQPRMNESFNLLYIRSHNRIAVYLIGTAVGLFLYRWKNCKKQLSTRTTLCGFLVSLAFLFAPMAYGSIFYEPNKTYNVIESALFGTLRRISWAIGCTVFMLCHRFGTFTLLDTLLSTRLTVFLSRITYGIYLFHFNFILSDVLSQRQSKYFSIADVVVQGIGDLVKAGTVTIVLVFILEIPLKRILKDFLVAKQIKKYETEPTTEGPNLFMIRL